MKKKTFNVDNLSIILNYSYDDEIENLEETMQDNSIEEPLPEELVDAIKFCEDNDLTDHIAYNLMLLKRDIQKS